MSRRDPGAQLEDEGAIPALPGLGVVSAETFKIGVRPPAPEELLLNIPVSPRGLHKILGKSQLLQVQ